ncbi:MAG: hypothetical protein QXX84_08545 [Sulfolobales archaeon]
MFSISIVWGSGILVTVDGRSIDPGFPEPRNVRPIIYSEGGKEKPLAIVSGYGDESILSSAFQIVDDVFVEWFDAVGSRSWRNPGDSEVKRIVSQVEERLMERYSGLRNLGVIPNTYLSLATITQDGSPRLYLFNERGLAVPRHSSPGYIVLGSHAGSAIAEAILRLTGYSPGESSAWNIGILSAFIILAASEVDPSISPNIGDSILLRLDPSEKEVVMGSIKDHVLLKLRERLERRREAFKILWKAMESLGDEREERVLRLLRNLIEGSGQRSEEAR